MSFTRTIMMCFVFVAAGCTSLSPTSQEGQAQSVSLLEMQIQAANVRIKDHSSHIDLVYAGFALNGKSSAFQQDILAFSGLTNRLSTNNVQLLFSNAQGAGTPILPYATLSDFMRGAESLERLAAETKAQSGRLPFLILLLTSHGAENTLALDAGGVSGTMHSKTIASLLEPLEAYPTLLVISACHSGSHIPALQRNNRIVLTASSAKKTSFGCSTNSSGTWFVRALAQSFDQKINLTQWFDRTSKLISGWEKKEGFHASEPQIWIGKDMADYAKVQLGHLIETKVAAVRKPEGDSQVAGR